MREYFAEHTADKSKNVIAYLAKTFDVEEGTVESVVYNLSWKHVKMIPVVNKNQKLTSENDIRKCY